MRAGLGLLVFGYILQIFTPLRLHTDAILYLSMAASRSDGNGLLFHGVDQKYPPGYPLFVSFLESLGIAKSGGFVFINLIFLFTGLYVLEKHYRTKLRLPLAVLLSFVVVKHSTFPATDIIFLGTSTLAMVYLAKFRETSGKASITWFLFYLSALLLSLSLRSIGVALLIPLAWVAIQKKAIQKIPRFAIVAVVGAVVSCVGYLVVQSTYFQESWQTYIRRPDLAHFLLEVVLTRFSELGEVVLNFPAGRIPTQFRIVFPIVGLAGIFFFMLPIVRRHRKMDLEEVYVASYALILGLWPCTDARFWIPILPFLILLVMKQRAPEGFARKIGILYLGGFAVMGGVALGYSTWLTFSGNHFPDRFGDGTLRETYRTAFTPGEVADPSQINQDALRVLRRY